MSVEKLHTYGNKSEIDQFRGPHHQQSKKNSENVTSIPTLFEMTHYYSRCSICQFSIKGKSEWQGEVWAARLEGQPCNEPELVP